MSTNKLFFLLLALVNPLTANEYSDLVYSKIRDLTSPTLEDYALVEKYMQSGIIPYKDGVCDWRNIPCYLPLNLTPRNTNEQICFTIYPNDKNRQSENCIVLYASFNGNCPNQLKALVQNIKKVGFSGDIITRIGGFPGIINKDLCLAHIPRAYKVAALKEALSLGYKRALWLNCNVKVHVSLDTIFKRLKKEGLYAYRYPYILRTLCNKKEHITAFNLTHEQACVLFAIDTSIIGVDFTDPVAFTLLQEWHRATKTKERASFTSQKETCLFSILVNDYYYSLQFPDSEDHINTDDLANLHFTIP